jgi:uncharacterized protein with HEPN domain
MPSSERVRMQHMLDAAREAVTFGSGCSSGELPSDRVRALALVKCIEIIGEAASKISDEVRAAHPEIPWPDIIGMRNRLIHAYFDIDFDRVCDTIEVDLPPLIASLERVLSDAAR